MFGTFDVSTSGMRAQRVRMNVIAQNLANVNSILDADGQPNPYRRQVTIMAQGADGKGTPGVRVAAIEQDGGPLRRVKDPDSEYADADGYVKYPNVNMVTENVDGMLAARAFEANVAAFELTKTMIGSALRILA
jgi:flagellar basal-body rod protein FlgC